MPTIPTLVTPGGEVIRDGAAIIEHFADDGVFDNAIGPDIHGQRYVGRRFAQFGAESLPRFELLAVCSDGPLHTFRCAASVRRLLEHTA